MWGPLGIRKAPQTSFASSCTFLHTLQTPTAVPREADRVGTLMPAQPQSSATVP